MVASEPSQALTDAQGTDLDAFCRQILLGTTLADKLAAPLRLIDERRDPWRGPLPLPGRPVHLQMAPAKAKRQKTFPSVDMLDNPRVRGEVLHYFANHELLAVELMALAVLRFQDAPPAFRRGFGGIMLEEQRHLGRYLEHMRHVGVEFGEIELSPFFWTCLAPIDQPLAFVAGMSLTLEQANLDFARYYRDAFAAVGDRPTAALLDEVYRDELGHVRHGLAWFRTWKDPGLDDYVAHARALQWPLTLARAKGTVFFADARVEAGLDSTYIERLEVTVASRGRPPMLWSFNPSAELEMAQGLGFAPRRHTRALRRDLEVLCGLLAAPDDLLVVEEPVSTAFMAQAAALDLPIPQQIKADPDGIFDAGTLPCPTLAGVRPWGLSPVVSRRFAGVADRVLSADERERLTWRPSLQTIGCKTNAWAWSAQWLRERPDTAFAATRLPAAGNLGKIARDLAEVEDALENFAKAGHRDFVLKTGLGMSGHGLQRLYQPQLTRELRIWAARALATSPGLLVEPWLDKVADYSARLWLCPDGTMQLQSVGRFLTDRRGTFVGAILGGMAAGVSPELARFLHGDGEDPEWMHKLYREAAQVLAPNLRQAGYFGPVGIDAFVYRDHVTQALQLRPIVEINPRLTMGFVAQKLESRLAPGRVGVWVLVRAKDRERADPASTWASWATHLTDEHPRELKFTSAGPRMQSGVWFTTEVLRAQEVCTVLAVDRTVAAAWQRLGALGEYLAMRIGAGAPAPCTDASRLSK